MSPENTPQAGCRLCQRGPTVGATLHQHRGRGLTLRHLVLREPLCRQCGLVAWRYMTVDTILLGWWGLVSVVATPVTFVLNSIALIQLLRTPVAPAVPVFPVTWAQPASDPL